MDQEQTNANSVSTTAVGSVGFEPSLAVKKIVLGLGNWNNPVSAHLELHNGSKLPVLYYNAMDSNLPSLAVLTTASSICGREIPTCLSPNGKTLFLGQQEFESESVFINKLLFPKEGVLPKSIQERVQLGIVNFQLTLSRTTGDLYQAYSSLLRSAYDTAPQPNQVLEIIYRSRSLEDYLFAVHCYGEGNSQKNSEFLHGGKAFENFVKNSFKEARNKLPLPDDLLKQRRNPAVEIGRLKLIRDAQLNKNSPVSYKAIESAKNRFAEFRQSKDR